MRFGGVFQLTMDGLKNLPIQLEQKVSYIGIGGEEIEEPIKI
jgi:hypothetical protein